MPHSIALSPRVTNADPPPAPTAMSPAPTGFSEIAAAFDHATNATLTAGHSLKLGDTVAEPLLSALLRFLVVFDALGSAVVAKLVRQDFRSKTDSVRSALNRERVTTVRALVAAERRRPPRPFLEANATEALLWAQRVLAFVDALVAHLLAHPGAQLRDATTTAYRDTLGANHNVVTRAVFENALQMLPDTTTFLCNLYNVDAPYDDAVAGSFNAAMAQFRVSVKPHIDAFRVVFPEQ